MLKFKWFESLRDRQRRKMLERLASGRVLDIGCSRYAEVLDSREDCQYVSLGQPGAAEARVQGSHRTLPFPSAVFDTVLILEPPPDPRMAVNEARRVLAPKGRLILSMPFPPDNEPADNYKRWSQHGFYILDTGQEV